MSLVTLRYSDGQERQFETAPGQTVLAAAMDAGVSVIHQCEGGSCGTCVARLVKGDTDVVPDRAVALFPGEVRDGLRLTCSTYVTTEAADFELLYPAALAAQADEFDLHEAKVESAEWVSRSVVRLRIKLPADREFAFIPGQYARLRVPGTEVWRSYSMANPSSSLPVLEFLIRYLPGGVMSEWLRNECRPGAVIEISNAMGGFTIQNNAPAIMIAGGTGLAPMMAMIDTIRSRPGMRHPTVLCFGCTHEDDFFFDDELELRSFWMPNLTVRTAVMGGAEADAGPRRVGTAVALIEDDDLKNPATVAYICGPPPMVDAARERLITGGLSAQSIFTEQFRPEA